MGARIDEGLPHRPRGHAGRRRLWPNVRLVRLAAIGLHQICAGDPRFEVFTPLFDKVTLTLDPKYTKGGTFTITTKNNSPENIYIQSATLNGKPFNRCWLNYAEITAGGQLDLVLGPQPNKSWGLAPGTPGPGNGPM